MYCKSKSSFCNICSSLTGYIHYNILYNFQKPVLHSLMLMNNVLYILPNSLNIKGYRKLLSISYVSTLYSSTQTWYDPPLFHTWYSSKTDLINFPVPGGTWIILGVSASVWGVLYTPLPVYESLCVWSCSSWRWTPCHTQYTWTVDLLSAFVCVDAVFYAVWRISNKLYICTQTHLNEFSRVLLNQNYL